MVLRRTLYLSFAQLLAFTSVAFSESDNDNTWQTCRSSDSCVIEYDYLSNQDTDPFLFLGRVMDKEHPRWGQYRKSLRRYPSVRDCLVTKKKYATEPKLLKIDWGNVGLTRGAEVCIFRIARSLGTIERLETWLTFHDFHVSGPKQVYGENYQPRSKSERVSFVQGTWTVEEFRLRRPSWFVSLTGFDPVNAYGFVIGLSQDNRVVSVRATSYTKFN